MSKNTQRQNRQAKKKAEKRRKEKLREKKQLVQSLTNRLEVRLHKQSPEAWTDECPQDVALFDEAVLAKLAEDEAAEARLVRTALVDVLERKSDQTADMLSSIPRRSPYSEWRMFIRGLIAWQAGKLDEAKDAWSRLDRKRRPWRIAVSLVLAHRGDLTELKLGGLATQTSPSDEWLAAVDERLLSHAKLVRQTQVDRVALRAARGVLKVTTDVKDATVAPDHIAWLRDFTKSYRSVEPELVQALHEAAIRRAFGGVYEDMFDECVRFFRGPRHDRHNTLIRYFRQFEANSVKSHWQLDEYMKVQLPQNQELSETLRAAIASELHCWNARLAESLDADPFSFSSRRSNSDTVVAHYEKAVKAFPANHDAYSAYAAFYEEELLDEKLSADKCREIEGKLAAVRARMVAQFPDDVETRLKLVDYLLENDRSDEAQTHIKQLAGTRTENPLADAMGWKWHILESMRLSRRKADLAQANQHLVEAEQQWPRWLSQEWLPYLRAALQYRAGQADAFDAMPDSLRSPSKAADACMRLGAAQRMSVASAGLKALRQGVDDHVKNVENLTPQELFPLASFFWDLTRCGLKYPAMRMHANKFIHQLPILFNHFSNPKERLDEPLVRAAVLALGSSGAFASNYGIRLPLGLVEVQYEPIVLAAILLTVTRGGFFYKMSTFASVGEKLRTVAKTERNIYERWLFQDLANRIDDKIRLDERRNGSSMWNMLNALESMSGADEDDEDDVVCNCPNCRRKRGEI